jgi:hypothetical protein
MTATTSVDHDNNKKVLKSAPPPWHAVALVVGLFAIFLRGLPSLESLDEIATLETIQHVNFRTIFSLKQVGCIRILSGSIMSMDSTYAFLFGAWEQDTVYWVSKLTPVQQMPFRGVFRAQPASIWSGLMTWSSFTMWAWIVEGWTFILLGVLTLLPPDTAPQWLYRIALIGWEISAPTSILVSAVVKYVLWPECAENAAKYKTHNVLKHPGALLEHNWNVLAALLDIGILGGLPVRFKDISVAPLFGLVYVVYSWCMMHSWCHPDKGPQFIYPFLDTTMGWTTSVALVALLLLLMLSYGIFAWADHVLTEYLGGNIVTHAVVVFLFAACVCRFRD